jgi:hypothetical protein
MTQAANSSQQGYIQPGSGSPFSFDESELGFDQGYLDGGMPLEDDALDDFFQAMVVGITGLDPTMTRPRWQEDPGNLPDYGTDWCALAVVDRVAAAYPTWIGHLDQGDGSDELHRTEELTILVTFYGPHCSGYATKLRDGLQIGQNREVLLLNNMGLVETGDLRRVPELIKNRWTDRADLNVMIRRQVKRVYPVLSLLSAHGRITTDTGVQTDFDTAQAVASGSFSLDHSVLDGPDTIS